MSFSLWSFRGEEFKLTHSEWYSLLLLIEQTEILPRKQISDMGWNCCDIEINGKITIAIAEVLGKIVKDKFDNKILETTGAHCESSRLLDVLQREMTYQVDYGVVKEFIEFCENSEGFEVC